MRARLLAAMTAALLAVALLSPAAQASTADDHCEQRPTVEKKCESTKG